MRGPIHAAFGAVPTSEYRARKSSLMKKLLIALVVTPYFLTAQDTCSCLDNLNWVITTFSENDAGFQYALQQKGEAAYLQHNEAFRKRAKSISSMQKCRPFLYEWLTFFRAGHMGIQNLSVSTSADSEAPSDDEIRARFKDAPAYTGSISEFEQYIESLGENAGYEGIWMSGNYTIGIKREGSKYLGFIIAGDDIYWQSKQIKMVLEEDEEGIKAKYHMRDHSLQLFEDVQLLGKSFLQTGFITWQRLQPQYEIDQSIERYFQLKNADGPSMQSLGSQTLLLRIPSFDYAQKTAIDSLLVAHQDALVSHKNLIIDLRDNGGGSDASYSELLKYIYTNPIRVVGLEYLSTPLNNARMQSVIDDPKYPESWKDWAAKALLVLEKHPGEFVNVDGTRVDLVTKDSVYPSPVNVAILINENCGSTTEQFLLAAKQSTKVKLYGTTTTGVLDISNQHSVTSPCEEFNLIYSLTKSYRIPEMAIDGKGIQPDFYIDKTIEPYQWIDFVRTTLGDE